jgi:multisubunit Na+/H+ antiporter MnhG subunit
VIELLRDLVGGASLAAGSIFLMIGAVGVLRFPDFPPGSPTPRGRA